ncbi:DUF5686 and carboxypeptidase-like regulatory domain-containing protein [Taibaiella koreensis]|uniref:DUF5686 and carboxypeptidase-like regulatory domain-containing protein n=1 Tax=Taibaiella koreensis TaxID=1268548 RepID=UPI000E59F9D2|nr:DUF5686 and carboxypeptidase-like regulatory domain-containing protein [Taibaiella koreensis]
MNGFGIWLLLAGLLTGSSLWAQEKIGGQVKDKKTGAPLSFVTVSVPGTAIGGFTDEDGRFLLDAPARADSLWVFMLGYKELLLPLAGKSLQALDIRLEEQGAMLAEVSVSSSKEKYRNRDNPAVALIRQVIDHKDRNYATGTGPLSYTRYEKLQVSLLKDRDSKKPAKKAALATYLYQNADTGKVAGKAALPVFVHEKASRYSRDPAGRTTNTLFGEKKAMLSGIIDDNGLEAYLDKIYSSTDIYDNNILLGDQQLLSPIAGLAPSFYKYYITDTIKDTTPWQIELSFFPRNKIDLLFKGTLLIRLDGSYAVSQAEMTVSRNINLNWVKGLKISLDYQRSDSGNYYLKQSNLGMELYIFSQKKGLYGERMVSVSGYRHAIAPDSLLKEQERPADALPDVAWDKLRPAGQTAAEANVSAHLDTLKRLPAFKRAANILTLALSGYEVLGPVEIGPVGSFYSFNPVEGLRLKLGGRTTVDFSKKFMFEGHVAYGFRDKQWKYNAGVTYSLTNRSIFEFPVRSISLRYSYETQIPGQDLAFVEEDNFLLSFKRGNNDKWYYNRKWQAEYVHETREHLAFRAGFSHSVQTPAGGLVYRMGQNGQPVLRRELTLTELSGEIRWAPHEQFYQGKKFRRPVFNAYPIVTLRGTMGIKGLMGADYSYRSLTLNIFKRFYLSQLGYSDVVLEGGRVWGHIPFPLLYIHKANQSYAYQLQSYNLMNFMEFASDRYVSLYIDHSFNGFFLNKVPLLNKLQLREVASFKALYGSIGSDNLPRRKSQGLFDFPVDNRGRQCMYSLDQAPYIEASLGISNIFKVLRVDVVRRFSYLDHPGITGWGVRGRIVLAL